MAVASSAKKTRWRTYPPRAMARRRRAVEAAVDLGDAVAAPLPLHVRRVAPSVRAEQAVAHGASWKTSPSVCRRPDRRTETPCRTGAADHPRAERTGRSRVVNK